MLTWLWGPAWSTHRWRSPPKRPTWLRVFIMLSNMKFHVGHLNLISICINFRSIDLKGELKKLLRTPFTIPTLSLTWHCWIEGQKMRKSSPQTDQGLNIFSSSEWPSAPINAVPRVAMLVHYSSPLVVSKGLKCSCRQIWPNFTSSRPRCSQVDQVGSASSLLGDSLNTEAALLRGFPPGRALSRPTSNEAVGTDGDPFLTGPTFHWRWSKGRHAIEKYVFDRWLFLVKAKTTKLIGWR